MCAPCWQTLSRVGEPDKGCVIWISQIKWLSDALQTLRFKGTSRFILCRRSLLYIREVKMEKWRKEGAGHQFSLAPCGCWLWQEQFELQDLQMGVIQIRSLTKTHVCVLTCICTLNCYLLASFKVLWRIKLALEHKGRMSGVWWGFLPPYFSPSQTIWAGKADPERAGEDGSYFVVYPKCAPGMFLRVILGWLWMDTSGLWQDFCQINWVFGDLPDTWNEMTLLLIALLRCSFYLLRLFVFYLTR